MISSFVIYLFSLVNYGLILRMISVELVEKNFGFNVTGQDFAGIKTFQDFYDLVITRMQEAK